MSLAMVRIDDRLIHGQVVVGWCPTLKPDLLVLCDDEITQNEWECEIYKDASGEYATAICSVEGTAALLREKNGKDNRIFVVVSSPRKIVELLDSGVEIDKVTVGGMHYREGKRRISNFIYVDDDDMQDFRTLCSRSIILEGRDLPGCKPIDLAKQLGIS